VKSENKEIKEEKKEEKEESEIDDDTDDSIEEFLEKKRELELIDLETPLIPYLIENNVSEKVRNKIIDLGYLTFNQFRLVEINELISDIQGKKNGINNVR